MNLQPAKIMISEADGGRICIGSEDRKLNREIILIQYPYI